METELLQSYITETKYKIETLCNSGSYKSALGFAEELLAVLKEKKGESNEVAWTYSMLAYIERCLEDYKSAETYLLEEIRVRKEMGVENIELALAYNWLGYIYLRLHKDDHFFVIHNYIKALDILKAISPDFDVDHSIAVVSYNLGLIHFYERHYTQAKDYLNASLDKVRSLYESEHPDRVLFENKIAEVFQEMESTDE